jgi:hypothetical protein
MTANDETIPLKARLEALAAFVPIFEAPGFKFGEWDTSEGHLPYFFQSEEASRFVQTAYEYGWCSSSVDWTNWIATDAAQRFANDPRLIAQATVSDLEHLLTTIIRQDRFVEGNLDGAFESGHLTAIVRRAEAMIREITA